MAYLFEVCDYWTDEQAADIENEPVISDVPALILAGEWDPVTPPQWGEDVGNNFSSVKFYALKGVGHGVTVVNDCAKTIMRSFLKKLAGRLDSACVLSLEEPLFALPPE